MNISNFLVTMAQTTENNQTNLFPFPFHVHLIFSMISTLFFFAMYNKYHKPYQLLMGFAVPISLVIWLSESKSLFYGVGIIELILLFASFLITVILKIKNKKAETSMSAASAVCEDDSKKADSVLNDETKNEEPSEDMQETTKDEPAENTSEGNAE